MANKTDPETWAYCPPLEVALAPMDADAVPGYINNIADLAPKFANTKDDVVRREMLQSAKDLVQALEKPRETMALHCWANPVAYMALATGVQTGLWKALSMNDDPKSAELLAQKTGTELPLVKRILKHMSAMGYIQETGVNEYKPTNFSRSLCIPVIGDGYPCMSAACLPATASLHTYLEERDNAEPNKLEDNVFQWAHKSERNFFQWMQDHPPYGPQFNHHMGGYRRGRPLWASFFDVQGQLTQGFDPEQGQGIFMIDIGGSIGHDLEQFIDMHPNTPGRLMLQDLPEVLGQIHEGLNPKIEIQQYNFHEEQPMKGARAYFMHSCLHDWPDKTCESILSRVKEAMTPGYSKLLINENVVPKYRANWQTTGLDLLMMVLFGSRERSEEDWHSLMNKAGLKIVKIWSASEPGVESLIEIMRP